MTRPLQMASLAAPAIRGINTQSSSVNLEDGFALTADNCVIDKFGRLGSRKGWEQVTLTKDGATAVGTNILGMHHFIDFTGASETFSWNATTFFRGKSALVTLAVEATSGKQTISAGNWTAATLNDLCYFFQEGYKPLVYDPTGNTNAGSLTTLEDFAGAAVAALPEAGFVMSAFGRLWAAGTVANKTKVWFTNVNTGLNWDTGTAGVLDIVSVFPQGTDSITGIASHNGALAILCKNTIVIYDDAVNNFSAGISVTDLTLTDVITGIGCIASKTIKNIGEDVIFLDSTGVRSLGRTVQEKSRPMRDLSMNVRDDIVAAIAGTADITEIHGMYSPIDSMYLLSFPTLALAYCFNTKGSLQDGSFRVTTWSAVPHVAYSYDTLLDVVDIATPDGIGTISGYTDNDAPYTMQFYTNHFDMGNTSATKILKKMNVTVIGGKGAVLNLKIGSDYATIFSSHTYTLISGVKYEYNPVGTTPLPPIAAEWGIAEFSSGITVENVRASVGGSGTVLQVGIETEITGGLISLQRLDILTKIGRTI